jgi:hypothetical protein
MKKRYDFSKSKPSPYVRKAKRSVTIRLDADHRRSVPKPDQPLSSGMRSGA